MQKKFDLPPERSLGYQIRRCHRMVDRLLSARLDKHNLNSGYWYYLRILWIQDGRTQRELSELTHVAENTTAAMINAMIKKGLVKRSRDSEDKRKLRVSLTPRGRGLQAELMHHGFEINEMASAGIARSDLDACLAVLARVAENLERQSDNPPADEPTPPRSDKRARRRGTASRRKTRDT